MKKVVMIVGLVLVLISVMAFLSLDNSSLAGSSGCCKYRKSTQGNWYKKDLTFDECKELNQRTDNDDVYEARGRVWWDDRCS